MPMSLGTAQQPWRVAARGTDSRPWFSPVERLGRLAPPRLSAFDLVNDLPEFVLDDDWEGRLGLPHGELCRLVHGPCPRVDRGRGFPTIGGVIDHVVHAGFPYGLRGGKGPEALPVRVTSCRA